MYSLLMFHGHTPLDEKVIHGFLGWKLKISTEGQVHIE